MTYSLAKRSHKVPQPEAGLRDPKWPATIQVPFQLDTEASFRISVPRFNSQLPSYSNKVFTLAKKVGMTWADRRGPATAHQRAPESTQNVFFW